MQAKTYIVPITDIFPLQPKDRMMQSTAGSGELTDPGMGAPIRHPLD